MKIGVAAYEMEGARTGVGRYLEGLLAGSRQCARDGRARDWTWRLFFKGEPFEHPLWSGGAAGGPAIEPCFDRRPDARPILWEQLRLPRLLRRDGVDLVFSPGYSLPPGVPAPSLVTVHDLSFEHLPGEFSVKERWRRRLLARRAVRRARRVLADTRRIAADLAETYDLDPGKIGVVPLALDSDAFARRQGTAEDDLELLAAEGVRKPYLLYLGSILERRQIGRMIAAFAALAADPDLTLVIAGRNRLRRPRRLERWIAGSGVAGRIVRRGYVAEPAVGALYRQSELTLYLSSYEGFGLPPLESLAAGTPAVVAPGLALDDLWPGYPYRCPGLDLDSVTATLRRALDDGGRRREIADEARRRLADLTWKRSAELFIDEIERAVAG